MSDNACFCGSGRPFAECCQPYIKGEKPAPTAEALMRSRYSAYASAAYDYLTATDHPDTRENYEHQANADVISWQGLQVLASEKGGADDDEGWVTFIASYTVSGVPHSIEEKSHFRRQDGRWFYYDGKARQAPRRSSDKVGRNDPCPCGSGKKFKKCCGK